MRLLERSPEAHGAPSLASHVLVTITVLSLVAIASGCAMVPPSVAAFRDTTKPVSVGPVQRIGGKPQTSGDSVADLRVKATNLYRFNSSPGGGGTIHEQTEDAGKFDIAVEKALDDCRSCRVRVDEVFVGSHSAVLIGTSDDTHWTGANVELYPAKSDGSRR